MATNQNGNSELWLLIYSNKLIIEIISALKRRFTFRIGKRKVIPKESEMWTHLFRIGNAFICGVEFFLAEKFINVQIKQNRRAKQKTSCLKTICYINSNSYLCEQRLMLEHTHFYKYFVTFSFQHNNGTLIRTIFSLCEDVDIVQSALNW